MSFATAAGALWGVVLVGTTLWVGSRLPPSGRRSVLWLFLAGALLTVFRGPASHLTVRVERSLFAGPDLLSGVPERTAVVQDSARAGGLSRVRRLRRTQGATLLSESRRVQLRIPWVWVAVAAAVGLGAGRARRPGPSRAAVLLVSGLGVPLLGGCADGAGPSPAEARLLEVLEMRRTGDVGGVEEVFLPEAVYEDAPGEFEHRGVPEIAAYLGGLHEWAGGVFLDVVRIHSGGGWAAAEWYLEGIQSGPVPGRMDTITGRRFRLRGITLVELERGAVIRAVDYLDWVPFLLDLGGEIRWPGGGITGGTPGTGLPEPSSGDGGGTPRE